MTTPTMKEMVETFLEGSIADKFGNVDPALGLTAVLEKHFGPMLLDRAAAAEARVKALEDALRPFAMFSRGYGRHARDDSWVLVVSGTGERKITMGDVRLAEDVLAALEAKP